MRKITGYIGALVIVISLMCTILAGYALNVDKSNVTVDKYDYVTDVSGLFEYSDEKQYIDYSPATNYTRYKLFSGQDTVTISNATNYPRVSNVNLSTSHYIEISYVRSTNVLKYEDHTDQINTYIVGPSINAGGAAVFFCNKYYFQNDWWTDGSTAGGMTSFSVQINNNGSYIVIVNGVQKYSSTTAFTYAFMYSATGNYIYAGMKGLGNAATVYVENANQIYYNSERGIGRGTDATLTDISTYGGYSIQSGIKQVNLANVNNNTYNGRTYVPYSFTVNTTDYGPGISYTSTTQLNNYIMNTSTTSSAPTTLTLTGSYIQATNVLTNPAYIRLYGVSGSDYVHLKNPYIVKFSDMVTSLNLSSSVTTVEFTNTGYSSYTNNNFDTEVSTNQVLFVTPSDFQTSNYDHDNNIEYVMSCAYNTVNYKAVYNAANGIVNIYYNDVWQSTGAASSTYIVYGGTPVKINVNSSTLSETSYTLSPSPTSYLTYRTYQETTYYMNISKGVSINNSNSNYYTKWSNGYENSIIDVLFRAENSAASYANTIGVGSDTITVNYTGGGYTAKINNGTATNIGDWRSIVLSIDALNNTVTAYPVKTFTTYVDVDVYDTPIVISGSLTTTGAVASLTFAAASSPLMMSIYNTHVFMDTYGAVMVDPSLDVNDYFNLNGFYRLNLYSFALSGDKITINGTDYTVTDNKITVNNAAHTLQNINITWRNGHTYLTFINDNVTVDLGSTTSTVLSMTGAWYFTTGLYSGYTTSELKYEWNWSNFIFNNGQFVVFFLGFGAAAFLVSKHFCSYSMMDYVLLILAVICAITVTVI